MDHLAVARVLAEVADLLQIWNANPFRIRVSILRAIEHVRASPRRSRSGA